MEDKTIQKSIHQSIQSRQAGRHSSNMKQAQPKYQAASKREQAMSNSKLEKGTYEGAAIQEIEKITQGDPLVAWESLPSL